MARQKKVSIESSIQGFRRVKTGKTVNYVSEEGIKLSRRQAEYVRDGKKSLQEAALTSFKGKHLDFPYSKRTGDRYAFKDYFALHDAVKSGLFDDGRMMILNFRGKAKVLYPGEEDTLYQWRAPVSASAKRTYSNPRFWENVIDHISDRMVGDPIDFEVIFLDNK